MDSCHQSGQSSGRGRLRTVLRGIREISYDRDVRLRYYPRLYPCLYPRWQKHHEVKTQEQADIHHHPRGVGDTQQALILLGVRHSRNTEE